MNHEHWNRNHPGYEHFPKGIMLYAEDVDYFFIEKEKVLKALDALDTSCICNGGHCFGCSTATIKNEIIKNLQLIDQWKGFFPDVEKISKENEVLEANDIIALAEEEKAKLMGVKTLLHVSCIDGCIPETKCDCDCHKEKS